MLSFILKYKSCSRVWFLGLIVFALGEGQLEAQAIDSISQKLDKVIREQMYKRSVPGLQLALFQPGGRLILESSYGYTDVKKQREVTKNTLFQAGALVRPLSAYTILKFLKRNEPDLGRALQKPVKAKIGKFSLAKYPLDNPVRWGHLLGMTSGLAPSREGVIAKEKEHKSRAEVLQKEGLLSLKFRPGSQIQIAPQGYAYLAEAIQSMSQRNFSSLVQDELQKGMALHHSCMLLKNCSKPEELSAGLTGLKSSYFPAPKIQVLFPAAASLFTRAQDYAHFLTQLWQKARQDSRSAASYLFQKHFQYGPDLGGTSHGFFFSRPLWYQKRNKYKESLVHYIESSLPGYAALAFISSQGYGAVLLINKDDLFFLRILQRELYHLYGIMNLDRDYPVPSFTDKEKGELWASYRPLAILPQKYAWLTFLNELQMRPHPQALELSSVFEKEVFVRLYPLNKKDLFLARGVVNMDGWRVRLRRDVEGRISGLDMDLASYRPVSKFFSAQSILLASGGLAGLPLFLALFYFIRRAKV